MTSACDDFDFLDGLSSVTECAMDNGCTEVMDFIRQRYGDRLTVFLKERIKQCEAIQTTLPPSVEGEDVGKDWDD